MVKTNQARILGILTIALSIVWTLIPNSHSLMVIWPGVFFWQVMVILPLLWLVAKLREWGQVAGQVEFGQVGFGREKLGLCALGGGFDGVMGISVLVLFLSTIASVSVPIATWYSLAALGALAAIYVLNDTVAESPSFGHFLWQIQGVVAIVFSLESLGLWWFKVYQPESERLATLEHQYNVDNVDLAFNFNQLDFQNWYPLGHQNYVAGYLILTLPFLIGLLIQAIVQKRQGQAGFWSIGIILQLLDLYSTSSRGGALSLAGIFLVMGLSGLLLLTRLNPLQRNPLGKILPVLMGVIAIVIFGFWQNDRLRLFLTALIEGNFENSQFSYRLITQTIGWNMGSRHPWTGLGLGSVPQVYQAYRPLWAGQEAELHYQLHSTPAQLWAELGLGGILILIGFIVLIIFHSFRSLSNNYKNNYKQLKIETIDSNIILAWSSLASLFGYGLMALTDYQLDTIAISSALIVSFVLFLRSSLGDVKHGEKAPTEVRISGLKEKILFYRLAGITTVGIVLALLCWLIPIHWAWATAQNGFDDLAADRPDQFSRKVTAAHALTPWEPYYAFQLAWNFGEFSRQTANADEAKALREQAIQWFQTAIVSAPDQEFGHANLGWLLLQDGQPQAAREALQRAIELVPAKDGLWFTLGLSEILDNQWEPAIDHWVRELLRHPLWISSPVWTVEPLKGLQNTVFDRLEQYCSTRIASAGIASEPTVSPDLLHYFHQVRGVLRWWRSDFGGAKEDWEITSNSLGLNLLELLTIEPTNPAKQPDQPIILDPLEESPATFLLKAWQEPEQSEQWFNQGWKRYLKQSNGLPTLSTAIVLQTLDESKAQNLSLLDWLKDQRHYRSYRPERLGFGVLSRHLGGAIPQDYGLRYENVLITEFLPGLFPERSFFPALDLDLNPFFPRFLNPPPEG